MERSSDSFDRADRALRLRSRLQQGLRDLVLASDESMSEEIDTLEDALDELEALFEEDEADPPWPGDPGARLGACRVELKRLRRGASTRRDAVRRIRLVLPGGIGARSTPPPRTSGGSGRGDREDPPREQDGSA